MHFRLEEELLNLQHVSKWSSFAFRQHQYYFVPTALFCTNSLALFLQLVVISASYPIYLLFSVFVLAILLAGKCNLAFNGRGARDFWSNPLTQTNPAKQFIKISKPNIAEYCYVLYISRNLMLILE